MRTPLSIAERERIHAAASAVERRTSALFALAIVPVSERYLLFPLVWGAILALAATGVLALVRPGLGIDLGFVINAALFILLSLLLDWLPLRLMLVPRRTKHAHARQLAHREFAARILANTQHRNGVLFFVSLGERYAEIIADRDIHARVPEGAWDKIIADFIAAVKSDRLADGFIIALDACAALLEEHYPRRDGAV